MQAPLGMLFWGVGGDMHVLVRGLNVSVSDSLKLRIENRLDLALGRFASHVADVQVRLSDTNDRHTGMDGRCQISARLRGSHPVWIDEIAADLATAVDVAADRLGQAVARRVERMHPDRLAG
jgi:ribosomal subunit interface protein